MQSFTTTPKFLEICLKCGRELQYNRLDDPNPITNENILKCYNCKIVFVKERDENIIYIFKITIRKNKAENEFVSTKMTMILILENFEEGAPDIFSKAREKPPESNFICANEYCHLESIPQNINIEEIDSKDPKELKCPMCGKKLIKLSKKRKGKHEN